MNTLNGQKDYEKSFFVGKKIGYNPTGYMEIEQITIPEILARANKRLEDKKGMAEQSEFVIVEKSIMISYRIVDGNGNAI